MTEREAHDAALLIRRYCKEQGDKCDYCIFKKHGINECRLASKDIPEFWVLRRVKKKG